MSLLQNCVVVVLCMIVSTSAVPREDNAEEMDSTDHEEDRRMAQEAFLRLSPYQRDRCLDRVPNEFSANEIMDMYLEFLRGVIRNQNMDRVEIPKFEEEFSKKIGFVTVKGSFKGEKGWLEKTTSIARHGNATVHLNETTVFLDSTLGLKELRLGMEYTARFLFIRVKGNLKADVESNAVTFSGGLEYTGGECRLFLKTFRLEELGKIVIHVTGLGKLNWIYSKIVTGITKRLRNKLRDTIEIKIRQVIEKELDKFKCPFLFRSL